MTYPEWFDSEAREIALWNPASAITGWQIGHAHAGDWQSAALCSRALEMQKEWRAGPVRKAYMVVYPDGSGDVMSDAHILHVCAVAKKASIVRNGETRVMVRDESGDWSCFSTYDKGELK